MTKPIPIKGLRVAPSMHPVILTQPGAPPPPSSKPPPKLIQSSGEFVAGFVAPSYTLDGILQERFCLTAATGAGKTAIALRLAVHVALGRKLGD